MLRSDLCDKSDAYIVVTGTITVEGDNAKKRNKNLTFKNNTPFWSSISKIHNKFIANAEDFDIVMPVYNLLEYSANYSMASGKLWNYRDEVNDDTNENSANRNKINNNKTISSKSFKYNTKLIGRTPSNNNIIDAEVVVPSKYLSNFWRFLDLLLTVK